MEISPIQLEDRVYRSYGILANARVIDSKEAMSRLSDVRLGIDLGLIRDVSAHVMNELMVITQPGFLQHQAGQVSHPGRARQAARRADSRAVGAGKAVLEGREPKGSDGVGIHPIRARC